MKRTIVNIETGERVIVVRVGDKAPLKKAGWKWVSHGAHVEHETISYYKDAYWLEV